MEEAARWGFLDETRIRMPARLARPQLPDWFAVFDDVRDNIDLRRYIGLLAGAMGARQLVPRGWGLGVLMRPTRVAAAGYLCCAAQSQSS